VWSRKAIREWVRANGNEQVRGGGRGMGGTGGAVSEGGVSGVMRDWVRVSPLVTLKIKPIS
jgi:hypothetical protein